MSLTRNVSNIVNLFVTLLPISSRTPDGSLVKVQNGRRRHATLKDQDEAKPQIYMEHVG